MLHSFLLLAGTLSIAASSVPPRSSAAIYADIAVGGPPRIALAGKGSGDITAEQWKAATELTVQGCTPGARLVGYMLSYTDAKGAVVEQGGKGAVLHQPLKDTVTALPDGTRFTVVARVVDGEGKEVKVPAATYTFRR